MNQLLYSTKKLKQLTSKHPRHMIVHENKIPYVEHLSRGKNLMKTSDEENFNGKTFDGKISIEHQLVLWLNQQECILVGCVPSAAVAAGGDVSAQGGVCPWGLSARGVSSQGFSAWGVSGLGDVCPGGLYQTPHPCEQND